jgi:hypothetical protein
VHVGEGMETPNEKGNHYITSNYFLFLFSSNDGIVHVEYYYFVLLIVCAE